MGPQVYLGPIKMCDWLDIKPGSSVHSSPLRKSSPPPFPHFQDPLRNFQVQVHLQAHFLARVQFQAQELTSDLAQELK